MLDEIKNEVMQGAELAEEDLEQVSGGLMPPAMNLDEGGESHGSGPEDHWFGD